jgi:DNA-binding MarR family transcriptional regulator
MDALQTGRADFGYSDQPPILLATTSEPAMLRAARTIQASNLRIGSMLPIESAKNRLELQASATAVWLELDQDAGAPLEELLNQVSRDVSEGRYGAVVSATAGLIDLVAARIGDARVELIVDANDAERTAALAMARQRISVRVSDVSNDSNAERLRQLSEEVNRIASALARLSTSGSAAPVMIHPSPVEGLPPLSVDRVRKVIEARRLRSRYFSEELFADPAWDMLLDLLQAEIAQLRVPVSSLCIAAAVPATTALRWLKAMVAQGLFIRRADPHDGRRVFVELAPETSRALRCYFAEAAQVAAI